MILRCVQGVEAEPFALHFGCFRNAETDLSKDRNNFALHQRKWMKTACVLTGRGQGNVHGNSKRLGIFGGIESPAGFPEHLLQLGLCLVNHLSERRTILLRQGTDAFHYGGQRTIAA